MSNPAWQQGAIFQDSSYFSFSSVSEFTCNPGQGQVFCPSELRTGVPAYFELQCGSGGYGVGAVGAGIAGVSYSGGNVRQNYNTAAAFWIDESGDVFINGTYSFSLSTTVTSGTTVRFYWDGAGHIGIATTSTNWNGGTHTDADIVNGIGLVAFSGFSAPAAAFVAPYGSAAQTWSIAASSSSCTFAAPTNGTTTVAYLAANAVLSIATASVTEGSAVNIVWAAANAAVVSGGLEYSFDGGAWTACGGTVTGTGGTATGPTVSDFLLHTIAIRETGAPLDATLAAGVFAAVPGTKLVSAVFTLTGTSSETFSLGGNFGTICFGAEAVQLATNAPAQLVGGELVFQGGSANDVEIISWLGSTDTTFTATSNSDFATISGNLTTGSITGTLIAIGSDNISYEITAGGTTVTGTIASGLSPFLGFNAVAIREAALGGQGNTYGIGVSAPPEEQLTLTSVGVSGGNTLSVGGFCNNAVLEQIDISVNDGGTWAESNSFSSSGGSVAAPFSALGSTLGAGSYEIIVRDHSNPTVESNMLPLTVSGGGASGSRVQVFIF